jgi:hypothetical protein
MAHSASDAANAGAMVVHTTEDTPVGDGDPICELAHVEGAIEAVTAGAKVIGRVMVLALQVENAFRNRISVTDKVADLRARLLRHYGEGTKSTGYRRAMTELAHAATLAVVHLCGAEEEGGSSLAVLGQGRLTQHTAGTLAGSAVATFGQIMARGPASWRRKNEPLAVLGEYMRDRVRFTHPRFTSSLLPFTTPQDTRLSTDLVYQLMLRMDPKSAGFEDGAVGKDAKADAERSVRETVAPQHNRDVRREQDDIEAAGKRLVEQLSRHSDQLRIAPHREQHSGTELGSKKRKSRVGTDQGHADRAVVGGGGGGGGGAPGAGACAPLGAGTGAALRTMLKIGYFLLNW